MENKTNSINGFGIACLVLGIVGMLTTCLFFGIIPCILSLIFGLIGIFQKNQSKTTSIIGLSCSSIGIIIFICIVIAVNLVPAETTSKETETIEKNIDNIDEIVLENENTQIENTNETVTEIENENTNENLNESLTENLVENTTPQPNTTTTSAIKKEQKEDSNDIGAIIVFIIIVAILIFAYKSATKTKLPKYDGKTPICPRCGKSHYHAMVTQEVVVPEKTKTQSSLNLNPLKPFTVMNHKQKVVQREISREVVRFVCDECGNIWS